MNCSQCNSTNTRVTCTNKKPTETWRYARCRDCGFKYKTVETYATETVVNLKNTAQTTWQQQSN